MNSPLKKNSFTSLLRNQDGAALAIVLFFSVFGLITISIYLLHQVSVSRASFNAPASVQTLANARSGIYKAFSMLTTDSVEAETLKTINALDMAMGSSLFLDTSKQISLGPTELTFDTIPMDLKIYSSDSFGDCRVSLTPDGPTCSIGSVGKYRGKERSVRAQLGCRISVQPDTCVIVSNNYAWEGSQPKCKIDTSLKREESSRLSKLISFYDQQIATNADSTLMDLPLTIQSQKDLDKLPSLVKGSLLIDGGFYDLHLKRDQQITVLGDIQITGTVLLESLHFIAAGEIKLLDKSDLRKCSLYSGAQIYIGDQATFRGNALARKSVVIYGRASVLDKSIVVSSGVPVKADSKHAGKPKPNNTSGKDSTQFSFFLYESAVFDGVGIALGTVGSIKVDKNVKVKGVLWATNAVCQTGQMQGLIRADKFIDCSTNRTASTVSSSGNSQSPTFNVIPGTLKPLENIGEYILPFFMNPLEIVAWHE